MTSRNSDRVELLLSAPEDGAALDARAAPDVASLSGYAEIGTERCRVYAAQARTLARQQSMMSELRAAYLAIAAEWDRWAVELEGRAGG